MKIQQATIEQVYQSLHTLPAGLPEAEAGRRLAEFGENTVAVAKTRHWSLLLAAQFTHFFAIILWVAAGLAWVADYQRPGEGMGLLGGVILGVIAINGCFSFWQEYRAERTLAALLRILPHRVRTLREGQVRELNVAQLVPGDIVLLSEGDDVPADCRLIEAHSVRVNTATLTGESAPVEKQAAPADEELLACPNFVLAGTALVAGTARAVVFATGMRTAFGRIAQLTASAKEPLSPLQREIKLLSRLVALLALCLGGVFYGAGWLIGLPAWDNLLFAIGIIVANVPEGLLPEMTLSMAMASQRMARRNALVRHLPAVETLGAASVICTDKTGTLTENRMAVAAVFLGEGIVPAAELPARPAAGTPLDALLEAALYCHSVNEQAVPCGQATLLGDPMEVALVSLARRLLPGAAPARRQDEIPFSAERKRQSRSLQARSRSRRRRRPEGPALRVRFVRA